MTLFSLLLVCFLVLFLLFPVNFFEFSSERGVGASDAGMCTCVMLEMLNNFVHSGPFPNDLILNFNGAEETGLQAAHAFITQHQWAPE